jgi:hypothetical protein
MTDSGANDTGAPGMDAQVVSDAADSGMDANNKDASDGSMPTDGGLVSQCQTLADGFIAAANKCGDTDRACVWKEYHDDLCVSGQTQLLVTSMQCFSMPPYCWTFSDPNQAESCIVQAHKTGESAAWQKLMQNYCSACPSQCMFPIQLWEVGPYLNDNDVAALANCWPQNCTDNPMIACRNAVPAVGKFLACIGK